MLVESFTSFRVESEPVSRNILCAMAMVQQNGPFRFPFPFRPIAHTKCPCQLARLHTQNIAGSYFMAVNSFVVGLSNFRWLLLCLFRSPPWLFHFLTITKTVVPIAPFRPTKNPTPPRWLQRHRVLSNLSPKHTPHTAINWRLPVLPFLPFLPFAYFIHWPIRFRYDYYYRIGRFATIVHDHLVSVAFCNSDQPDSLWCGRQRRRPPGSSSMLPFLSKQ